MKNFFFLGMLLAVGHSSFSQMVLQDPVSARTFNTEKYSGVRGTPFLFDKWIKGTVTTPAGIYKNLDLKLEAYSNALYFSRNDEVFEFTDPILAFTLMPKPNDAASGLNFKKGLSASGLEPTQFVQVLVEGRISLYRSDIKQLSEMSEINAGIVKTFATATRYYIQVNKLVKLLKVNKEEVLELLKDKEETIQPYIKENKIGFKKESDLVSLLKYYNSL